MQEDSDKVRHSHDLDYARSLSINTTAPRGPSAETPGHHTASRGPSSVTSRHAASGGLSRVIPQRRAVPPQNTRHHTASRSPSTITPRHAASRAPSLVVIDSVAIAGIWSCLVCSQGCVNITRIWVLYAVKVAWLSSSFIIVQLH